MNLYLFNENDCASTYGIGAYLKELTKAIESTFINVHIVHLRSVRPEFEIEKTNQVEHWHIPEVRNKNTFSGAVSIVESYLRNVVYLLRLHIKDTENLVFHFNYNTYQLLAKELKAIFNCKTVTTVHYAKWMLELNSNLSMLHTIKSKPSNLLSKYEKSLAKTDEYENLQYKEVDHIIALCRHMHDLLQTEYGIEQDKIAVIPNGLISMDNNGILDRMALREKWNMSEKEFIILFAGRLNVVKGLDYLIKAFHKVLKIIPNCRLMIAGNGAYDCFMKECEDIWMNITWTGLIGKEKLYELYSIADIGVMPSFHEQCSYVAIEMMMHGVPLIASTSSGLREMIEDGITGLYIPVIEYENRVEIDANLLAEKMLFLLEHPEERKCMGDNARKRYKTVYSAEIFRQNMLDFYNTLKMKMTEKIIY
jgi:glycosyltransferase